MKPTLFILLPFLFSSIFADTNKKDTIEKMYNKYRKNFSNIDEINPKEAHALSKKQSVIFVDIREKKEQAISMIPGAITQKEFLQKKENYRNHIIIPYCTIGYRSGLFTKELKKQNFKAKNLRGSILSWVHEGLHVEHQGEISKKVHVYGPTWNLLPKHYQAVW